MLFKFIGICGFFMANKMWTKLYKQINEMNKNTSTKTDVFQMHVIENSKTFCGVTYVNINHQDEIKNS